jgi:hypothetical protein
MRRRTLMASLPALMAGSRVLAQDAAASASAARAPTPTPTPKYVVMSLIGDKLTYVVRIGLDSATGGHTKETEVPVPGAPHDTAALQAIAGALPASDPGAAMSFLAASSPALYAGQDDWFDGATAKLPETLRKAVAGEHASLLLLLTKWRGEAEILDGHTSVGHGKLAGLGFYLYSIRERADVNSPGVVKGYIAPYVYARLSLIDLATSKVLREQLVHTGTPFVDLTPKGQLEALETLLEASLKEAVANVLKPA